MESVLIEKQQNTQKQKIKMAVFVREFSQKFNVDCSLSYDNSNMFVYTNSLNSVL